MFLRKNVMRPFTKKFRSDNGDQFVESQRKRMVERERKKPRKEIILNKHCTHFVISIFWFIWGHCCHFWPAHFDLPPDIATNLAQMTLEGGKSKSKVLKWQYSSKWTLLLLLLKWQYSSKWTLLLFLISYDYTNVVHYAMCNREKMMTLKCLHVFGNWKMMTHINALMVGWKW